jgi:hypothetical protein
MSDTKWPSASRERPCPKCGKWNRCRIAPDETAGICWRSGSSEPWHDRANGTPHASGNGYIGRSRRPKSKSDKAAKAHPTPEAAFAACYVPGGKLVATWKYPGDVARVGRWEFPDKPKECRPVHRVDGGWSIGKPPGLWPLYRADELPSTGTIFVVEGEKCADCGWSIGLPCVTSAHGSGAAGETDWKPLAGRDVVILPDNDEPGRKYARHVATILAKLEPPARVRIVQLPGLPDGGDIVEFIESRDSSESEAIAAEIVALADAVPWIDPAGLIGGPLLVCMADVEPRAVQWLWPGRIPLGRLTFLAGRPGLGKSFATCDISSRVSTGAPWPDGTDCPVGSVILICSEDDPHDTIRPRLDAHCADLRRIRLLTTIRRFSDDGKPHEIMFSLTDVAALEAALLALPDCKLVVVDPIGSFIGAQTDAHRENEVRAVLGPVAKLAERYGVAVLIVAHVRKNSGSGADQAILGSTGFVAIARQVWHLWRDAQNRDRRLLLPGKANLSRDGHGLAFSIVGDPPAISWERDAVRMSADEAAQVEHGGGTPGPEPEARNAAAEWLGELLACGPVPSGDLKEPAPGSVRASAKAADLKWATVRCAADSLGVRRERCRFSGVWTWRLPKPGNQVAQEDEQAGLRVSNLSNLSNIDK